MRVTDEMVSAALRCQPFPEDRYDNGNMFNMFWRLPSEKRSAAMRAALEAALSHAAGQEAVAWILQTGHGTGLHEGARPPVENVGWRPLVYAAAPPITSAEVGQDGEQCRAASVASGEAEELAEKLDRDFDSDRVDWDNLADAARLLRALSRGVPEGK